MNLPYGKVTREDGMVFWNICRAITSISS